MPPPLQYGELTALKKMNPAWRLLSAHHAPLIISFLHQAFVANNRRQIKESEVLALLDTHLETVRRLAGTDEYAKTARFYLSEWMSVNAGWLRSSYEARGDEPMIDLTAAAERAIEWVSSLQRRSSFIGTKSTLKHIFELLREIKAGSEANPDVKLAELERQRKEIDDEIFRVLQGEVKALSSVEIKERFQQVMSNSQRILSDMRGVEQNFRQLDLHARQKIATWDAGKGALLGELFEGATSIQQSEQGQSFTAFWDFLMSPDRQAELGSLLERAMQLEDVKAINDDPRLRSMNRDWIAAADEAQATVSRLSEQLRRFLDDRSWMQNKRIVELIQGIERVANAIADDPPEDDIMEIQSIGIEVTLPMDRTLYRQPKVVSLEIAPIVSGESDASTDILYQHIYVDPVRLQANIDHALQDRPLVSVADIVADHPLLYGVAELIGYLRLAAASEKAFISDELREKISWQSGEDMERTADIPHTFFQR